jgi:hypothetical protein
MKIAELFKHMIDLLDQEEQAQSQSATRQVYQALPLPVLTV